MIGVDTVQASPRCFGSVSELLLTRLVEAEGIADDGLEIAGLVHVTPTKSGDCVQVHLVRVNGNMIEIASENCQCPTLAG